MIWLIGNRGMLGIEVEELLKKHKINYVASDQEVDITNIDELREFSADKHITWIINCAAYTAVGKAEDEPDLAFKLNAAGPLNIAKIAIAKNAKLIHISTDYVFDGAKEGAYTEEDTPNPINIYGASKYKGELNIQENLGEYFIIRTSWLYGKYGNNFVKTMLQLFKKNDDISVVDDQWGSPTYAGDLAALIVQIISHNSSAYGIYNFTNEGRINWFIFASRIYKQAQALGLINRHVQLRPTNTNHYRTKAKRPLNSYLSKEKVIGTFDAKLTPWGKSLVELINRLLTA